MAGQEAPVHRGGGATRDDVGLVAAVDHRGVRRVAQDHVDQVGHRPHLLQDDVHIGRIEAGAEQFGGALQQHPHRLDWVTWARFIGWMVVGLLVYGFYGYRRSALADKSVAGMR
ncbi:amino acid permease C-terminal domain-containing protein [Saccharopolyspora sp. ASAGF58]|uniref:amino acid permease C-terminal domain-containing protein n=1 Tax=Saccharopolyspora sp. ASAGF58 TaxID=2719023 RepID=UPI001FF087DF|nr:amino acid permease C-terminal domain-containing protein [Saccharopolyspora sp. ASAGF58]